MAQSKVTSYYCTRKRVHESKIEIKNTKAEIVNSVFDKSRVLEDRDEYITPEVRLQKSKTVSQEPCADTIELEDKKVPKRKGAKSKQTKSTKSKTRTKKGAPGLDQKSSDIRKAFQTQKEKSGVFEQEEKCLIAADKEIKGESEVIPPEVDKAIANTGDTTSCQSRCPQIVTPQKNKDSSDLTALRVSSPNKETVETTPKRGLIHPEESGSKKKKCVSYQHLEDVNLSTSVSPQKGIRVILGTSCKRLDLTSELPSHPSNSVEQKLKVTLTDAQRSKLLNSGRLDTVKQRFAKFQKSLSAKNESENNKCKITSVISATAKSSSHVATTPVQVPIPTPSANERLRSLAIPDVLPLTLPSKYKLLGDMFRCCDSVVSMLHNRKEVCYFQKLKQAVQDMTRRTFTKNHLGQIKTVFPLAYYYTQEKLPAHYIMNSPKPRVSQYELVIAPNLKSFRQQSEGDSIVSEIHSSKAQKNDIKNKTSSQEQMSLTSNAMQMNPALLVERRNIFNWYLLKIVKNHHQDFLARLNPPITVRSEKLTSWHAKFPLDSVPDIQLSPLPEPADVQKCCTAMDVLNKIKGTVNERMEKALKIVADKASPSSGSSKPAKPINKDPVKSGGLNNFCSDLLEKIRAREAANMLLEMTTPPEEKKRMQMMEGVPEMVRILRNFFISARKAAVHMDEAIQKIMDSYHSPISSEDVKAHLKLIAEVLPDWLLFVTIRKGVYLKIDKNKDINVMLNSLVKK